MNIEQRRGQIENSSLREIQHSAEFNAYLIKIFSIYTCYRTDKISSAILPDWYVDIVYYTRT